jgi:hypothetical protein
VITDTGYSEGSVPVHPNASIFTYSSGDTVYILNNGVFVPSFYFGCHTGDTLLVPWSNIRVATYVDATGIMVINGDSLRFYNYHAIDSVYACIGMGIGQLEGRIIERLGNIVVGPGNNSFSFDFSCFEYQEEYFLHCYQDDSFALYSTNSTEACTYIETGVKDMITQIELTLAPNPTDGYCRLQLSSSAETYEAVIYDVTGRVVMPLFSQQHITSFNFSTASLPGGLYFVKVTDGTGRIAVVKLVKD